MKPILVVCGDKPIMPPSRQVWTVCKCGEDIVHDVQMEARLRENHPGNEIEWSCLSCNASRLLDPEVVRRMLADTRANISPELRQMLARVPDEVVIREISRLVPQ